MFTLFACFFTGIYFICFIVGFPLTFVFWLLALLDGIKMTYKQWVIEFFNFGVNLFKYIRSGMRE